jgi:hypothetical protein
MLSKSAVGYGMSNISYRRHRFPPEIIQHAIWLYFRFPLSYRNVEDLLTERGIDLSYETVRRWALKFGTLYARKLRRQRPLASRRGCAAKVPAVMQVPSCTEDEGGPLEADRQG